MPSSTSATRIAPTNAQISCKLSRSLTLGLEGRVSKGVLIMLVPFAGCDRPKLGALVASNPCCHALPRVRIAGGGVGIGGLMA